MNCMQEHKRQKTEGKRHYLSVCISYCFEKNFIWCMTPTHAATIAAAAANSTGRTEKNL